MQQLQEKGKHQDYLLGGFQHEQSYKGELHTKTIFRLTPNTNRVTKKKVKHKDCWLATLIHSVNIKHKN